MPPIPRPDPLAFSGASALLHIRERLWSTERMGRAAVLVGAGFSRNATKLTPNAPSFPVWWELRDALVARLNIPAKVAADLSAMRLGSLVEASFGRAALDSILQDTIPWQQHIPGSIHEKLLRLPWADIFTTNYDTLLEDARGQIVDRTYSLVVNAGDLPDRPQPRIVKLHGSFPSERPYLFTEEDFRAYPRASAPFVNLVQGSMMENVMCLIGFSGEDPNFTAWAGWVRDNLGDHAPNIYLCGVLDISDAQRRYLEARRVTTVDLGSLFPASSWPDPAERHQVATEWLLDSLQAGERENVSQWPMPGASELPVSDDLRVPQVLPYSPRESGWPYTSQPLLSAWHLGWERAFRTYPGWELAPREGRAELQDLVLWSSDEAFLPDPVLDAPTDFLAASSVVRRAHLIAQPISNIVAERLVRVVQSYHPFGLPDGTTGFAPEGPTLMVPAEWSPTGAARPFNWADVRQRWMEMVLALMAHARVTFEESEFERWSDVSRPYLDRNPQWLAQWHHEQVLFALGRHELRRAGAAIEAWPEASTAPFWETRRAALHAELGNTAEAWRVALRALDSLRKRLVAARTDATLQSQEQLTIALLHRLAWVSTNPEDHRRRDTELRHRNLHDRRGFNEDELWHMAQAVQAFPLVQEHEEVEWAFDPGEIISRPASGHRQPGPTGPEASRLSAALALLDVLDRIACPPRLASGDVAVGIIHAARIVWPSAPIRAISMLIRLGDFPTTHIKTLMTRAAVVHLSEAAVALLFEMYSRAFSEAQGRLSAPQAEHALNDRFTPPLRESAEILSRLAFRLTAFQAEQLMGLVTSCYTSLALRREPQRGEVADLFRRLLEAMTPKVRSLWLPFLVALPLPGEPGMELDDPRFVHYPEPVGYLVLPASFDRSDLIADSGFQRSVVQLIEKVRNQQELIRSSAVHRFHQLMRLDLVDQTQVSAFWQALDSVQTPNCLPRDVNHAAVLLTHSPENHAESARLRLQEALRRLALGEGDKPQLFKELGLDPGQEFLELGRVIMLQLRASERPEWSVEDTKRLCAITTQRCQQYWHSRESLPIWPWDWNPALASVWALASVMPLHRDHPVYAEASATLSELMRQAVSLPVPIGLVVPQLVQIGIWTPEQVEDWLKQGLRSNEPHRILDVVRAIREWATPAFSSDKTDSHPLTRTIQEMCTRVRVRHPVALEGVLRALTDVLHSGGALASLVRTDDLLEGLADLFVETTMHEVAWFQSMDRLALRHRSSELAAQLYPRFPEAFEIWRTVCRADLLPEVRAPWDEFPESVILRRDL